MKIKVNDRVVCLPPYLSTSWSNISSLSVENGELIFSLKDGAKVRVPHLSSEVIGLIFEIHSRVTERDVVPARDFEPPIEKLTEVLSQFSQMFPGEAMGKGAFPVQFGFGAEGLAGMGAVLQHNQQYANSPDLPAEVLDKVCHIVKVLGENESLQLPDSQPHCNCYHCQIARAIHLAIDSKEEEIEEDVTEEDLKFRLWDIVQMSDTLYTVTNPLDTVETYQVYLGETIGCTCGHEHCAHVRAVLES